jgi:hypothetical protein
VNIIELEVKVHQKINGYCSSTRPGGKTVRQWLSGQSFEAQEAFGKQIVQRFGVAP